jgi:vancomycin resistance protein YoaR
VTAADLEPVLDEVRTALAAPVRFGWRDAHWTVHPKELATLLRLPADGRRKLEIGGPAADRYFGQLSRAVDRKPKAAQFAIEGERVRVAPSSSGRKLDLAATRKALLGAALSTEDRNAELVVASVEPALTTEKAKAMKVTHVLASYTTPYSGSYDRIRNLQLAAGHIDGTAIARDETFSFNTVVGPRTVKRGFRKAPAIMDGEYEDQVGGGVSQVATTIFNAAWEAGVKITQRTPHSLYIDRYPLGRDATVNYPDVDLRFVNDTKGWMVVRGEATDAGITVSLLGTPTGRRVESEAGELRETGPPEEERVPDPTLYVGQEIVVEEGEPSREVSVRRTVYEGDEILYQETWYTRFLSEPTVVRVGTIPVEVEPPPAPPPAAPQPPVAPPTPAPAPTAPPPPPPPPATTPTTTSP